MNDLSNIILAPFLVLCLSLVFDRKVTVVSLSPRRRREDNFLET